MVRSLYANLTVEISSALKKKVKNAARECVLYIYKHINQTLSEQKKKPLDSLKQDFKEQDESKKVNNEVGQR